MRGRWIKLGLGCALAMLAAAASGAAESDSLRVWLDAAERSYRAGAPAEARVGLLRANDLAARSNDSDMVWHARAAFLEAQIARDLNDPLATRAADERALALLARIPGTQDSLADAVLQHYVGTLRTVGEYTLALEHGRELVDRRNASPRANLTDKATASGLLAAVYADIGRFVEATPLMQAAYEQLVRSAGPDAPVTLGRLINLGNLARARGDHAQAESLYIRLVDARKRTLGPAHLGVAEALYNLALTEHMLGKDSLAMEHGEAAARIRRDQWRATIPFLPEQAAFQLTNEYWRGHEVALDAALELARSERADPQAVLQLWSTASTMRTLVFDEVVARRRDLRHAQSPAAAIWARWDSTRSRISDVFTRDVVALRDPTQRSRLDSLRAAADSLEWRALAIERPERAAVRSRAASWPEVLRAVKPGHALVGCFRYGRVIQTSALQRWQKDLRFRYAAIVYRGMDSTFRVVDLGDAGEVDSLVTLYRQRIATTGANSPRAAARLDALGTTLRARLWDRIGRATGGALHIAIVGDGELDRMPWEALPMPGRPPRYLIDSHIQITRLSSELDLVAGASAPAPPTRIVLAGGPAFDTTPPARTSTASLSRGTQATGCAQLAIGHLSALPGAVAETRALEKLAREIALPVMSATGERLTRDWFELHAPRAQVLHLATHTFVIADSCLPARYPRDQWLLEPLLRNGLAFAGANRISAAAETSSPLLTGADIATLDLRETREVLLSACASGQGESSLIEGSFGLPRAFRSAGATRVVCSQWPVSDELSASWMLVYARARWQRHESATSACRSASRALLDAQRKGGGRIAVRDWAAYVVWGPPE